MSLTNVDLWNKVCLVGELMQSEVIDDILNVEAEADKIVSEAEKEAQNMILEAQADARKKIQTRVEQVRKEGSDALDSANKTLDAHLAQYEQERIKIEKEGAKVDPDALSRMVKRAIERISSIG